jgi:hypothetical protein
MLGEGAAPGSLVAESLRTSRISAHGLSHGWAEARRLQADEEGEGPSGEEENARCKNLYVVGELGGRFKEFIILLFIYFQTGHTFLGFQVVSQLAIGANPWLKVQSSPIKGADAWWVSKSGGLLAVVSGVYGREGIFWE